MRQEADYQRIARRRQAFAIIFYREGVGAGDEPMQLAQDTLQLGPTGVRSLVLEEFDEGGVADRLTEPWRAFERNRLDYLMGFRKRHPKKPAGPRLQSDPEGKILAIPPR